MRLTFTTIILSILLLVSPKYGNTQAVCGEIVKHGIYDSVKSYKQSELTHWIRKTQCGKEEEHRIKTGALDVMYASIWVGGKYSDDKDIVKEVCNTYDATKMNKETSFFEGRVFSKNMYELLKHCVSAEGGLPTVRAIPSEIETKNINVEIGYFPTRKNAPDLEYIMTPENIVCERNEFKDVNAMEWTKGKNEKVTIDGREGVKYIVKAYSYNRINCIFEGAAEIGTIEVATKQAPSETIKLTRFTKEEDNPFNVICTDFNHFSVNQLLKKYEDELDKGNDNKPICKQPDADSDPAEHKFPDGLIPQKLASKTLVNYREDIITRIASKFRSNPRCFMLYKDGSDDKTDWKIMYPVKKLNNSNKATMACNIFHYDLS